MAGFVGLGQLDDAVTRRAIRRLGLIALVAWPLAVLAPWGGLVSPIAGLAVLSVVIALLTGGLLSASQTNFELATLLASGDFVPVAPAAQPVAAMPLPMPPAPLPPVLQPLMSSTASSQSRNVLTRGDLNGRNYSVFTDGSIEMDTVFGPRWFASIDLAREFIGVGKDAGRSMPQAALAHFN